MWCSPGVATEVLLGKQHVHWTWWPCHGLAHHQRAPAHRTRSASIEMQFDGPCRYLNPCRTYFGSVIPRFAKSICHLLTQWHRNSTTTKSWSSYVSARTRTLSPPRNGSRYVRRGTMTMSLASWRQVCICLYICWDIWDIPCSIRGTDALESGDQTLTWSNWAMPHLQNMSK